MHELLQYLNRQGVTTFLTVAQHGLVGDMRVPVDVTYLADTVVLLRYFEALGRVRRAISVVKKRAGGHEDTVREFRIGAGGIRSRPCHSAPFVIGKNRLILSFSINSNSFTIKASRG